MNSPLSSKKVAHNHSVAELNARLRSIPFINATGLLSQDTHPDRVECRLPFQPALADRRHPSAFCNGAVLTVLDQMGSVAIWERYGLQFPHATVSLSASFSSQCEESALHCTARILSSTDEFCTTFIEVFGEDSRKPIAAAQSIFVMGKYPGQADNPSRSNESTSADDSEFHRFSDLLGYVPDPKGGDIHPSPRTIGSTNPVALHGGAIAGGICLAATDCTGSFESLRLSHISIEYLRAGLPLLTGFHPTLIQRGRSASALRVDASQKDTTRLIATATARFVNDKNH